MYRNVCKPCGGELYRGFLCERCWVSLTSLRSIWESEFREALRPRSPAHEARIAEYRERVGRGERLFEPTPGG